MSARDRHCVAGAAQIDFVSVEVVGDSDGGGTTSSSTDQYRRKPDYIGSKHVTGGA